MLDHPTYLQLLVDEVIPFLTADGSLLLVSPGWVDRFEMADRAFMIVAPRVGDDELARRARGEGTTGHIALAVRVDWQNVTGDDNGLRLIGRHDAGVPVTVVNLTGLVATDEICD